MIKSEILELVELIKIIKCDNVATCGNIIIGSDKDFVSFRKVDLGYELPKLAFNKLEVVNYLKEYEDSNPVNINIFDHKIFYRLLGMMKTLENIEYIREIYYLNIREDIDFKEALDRKTDQGIKYVIRDNKYNIPIYNNLLPVVKTDKVDLIIYDSFDNYSFLCKFIVHKKKNINIEVYLLCIHMFNQITV